MKKNRIHIITQTSAVECGSACLTMICNYYGYDTTLEEVNEILSPGRDGISAQHIVVTAKKLGLDVMACSIQDVKDLRYIDQPIIAHWRFNHFVVIEKFDAKKKVQSPGS